MNSIPSDSTRARRRKHEESEDESISKKARKTCDCTNISPQSCQTCAKVARKIYRLFGKRLALTDIEMSAQPPSKSSQSDGLLVFADEPCDCPAENAEGCTICANFAIKMGLFVKIYSHRGLEEVTSCKYSTDCDCDYISNVGCTSCTAIIGKIEQIFNKNVYPTCVPDSKTNAHKRLPSVTSAVASGPSPLHECTPTLASYVAVDCEMVGVMDYTQKNAKGRPKMVNALARCSIVDTGCNVLLDIYVKPDRPIADYRTRYSGITRANMKKAVSTSVGRQRIKDMLKDKVVVGHTLSSDFDAIAYRPPDSLCRDIANCQTLRDMYLRKSGLSGPGLERVGLKKLSAVLLNSRIQTGSHCSVEDAIHTMKLFLLVKDKWKSSDDESHEPTPAVTSFTSLHACAAKNGLGGDIR